ncbi:MAG: hypothetical protein IPM92_08395 [Saprospiraceae bacterium]|nr:hypothetical protein [Saprospiraceae bacterium]
MKTSILFAFPFFLLSPFSSSLHLNGDDQMKSNIYALPICDSESSLGAQLEKLSANLEAPNMVLGETKNQKQNDPILGPIIFEICYKRCGDPGFVENGPCWFHCRYSFYLLGKRNRK